MAAIVPIVKIVAGVASTIPFTACFDLIDKIYTCICEAHDNDGHCDHIATQAKAIKATLADLERLNVISDAVHHSVHLLERNLQKCEQYIDSMYDRTMSRPKDFLQSRKYSRDLQALKKDLDSACITFTSSACSQLLLHAQGVPVGVSSDSKTSFPVPRKPRGFHVSKRAHNKVQLRWEAPSDDPDTASRYAVQYRKRWGKWVSCEEKPTTTKLTISGLSADSKYWFRARAENRDGVAGRFSDGINVETKYSPLARGFMYAGAALGGTLSAPVFAPAMAVYGLHEAGKKGSLGVGEAAVATAPIIGTIGAPVIGWAAASTLHDELKPDEFSDNED